MSHYITKPKFYTQTNYPDLYSCKYWGNHKGKEHPEIIANRNKFVTDFNISFKGGCSPPRYVCKHVYGCPEFKQDRFDYCDHSEFYKTTDRHYIIIVSPCAFYNKCVENGFVEIYPMYQQSTKTYMKKINMNTKRSEPLQSDQFWFNLGKRHCKIKAYVEYLTLSEDKRVARHAGTLKTRLLHLASPLDDIVCKVYPRDIHDLETIESKPRIIDVFYNLCDKDEMIKDDDSFLEELTDYLDFVKRLDLDDKVNKAIQSVSNHKITKGYVIW